MSSSPFAAFQNATLDFQVASGSLQPDSKGNLRPGKAIVRVEAMLQQDRNPRRQPLAGVDTTQIAVKGRITLVANQSGLTLPSIITPDSRCACTWQGRSGQFVLEFEARNPYLAALEIDSLESIKGWFIPGSFAVEGDPYVPTPPTPEPTPEGNLIKIAFAFGDATPKPIATVEAGQTIVTAQIVIQIPFNGVGASLTLGDALVSDRLIRANQNDPSFAAEYETNPALTYTSATQIQLAIVPGEGATSGSGFVILEVV